MIFYDSKDKRKKYVRWFFVVITIFVFVLVFSFLFTTAFLLKEKTDSTDRVDIAKIYKYYKTPLNDKKITLTFDDGPNPIYTPQVVELLKKYDIPATFFFIGENVVKHPLLAKEVADMGFEIGNHTLTHSQAVHDSPERLQGELRTTKKILEVATGKKPLFYRPPYLLDIGDDPTINPEVSPEKPLLVAYDEGYIPVGADVDSKDWLVVSGGELLQNVLKNSSHGHMILLHDGGYSDTKYMMQVLEEMIVKLKAEGYQFVTIRELFLPPKEINLTKNLTFGMVDAEEDRQISLLQWFLYTENFLEHNAINGKFDDNTRTALENWQLKHQIIRPDNTDNPEYGKVGANTRAAILSVSQSNPIHSFTSVQEPASFSIGRMFEWVNLVAAAGVISISKYVFFVIIILIISRISVIAFLYLFSIAKVWKKKTPDLSYDKGVSVLVPAYNEAENIESTLRSIMRNDYPTKEVIVINDGSTDDTALVVRNLQQIYPTIKLLDVPNGGKANALNLGVKEASHDVVICMDADTVFAPSTIRHLVKHFKDKKVGAVAGKVETTRSRNLLDIFQSIEYEVGQNIEKKVFGSVNAISVVPGPVGAWRKKAIKKCGGYSHDTLVEDQDLTLAVLTQGYKIAYEPQAVCYTETPHTLKDFLKQRFRWIYGTIQCAWKYRNYVIKKPFSSFSWVVMPNTAFYSVLVPLFYPIIDLMLLFGILLGFWKQVLLAYVIYTLVDCAYAAIAFIGTKGNWWRLVFIPIQRLYYRQVIYYVVAKSLLKAFEGTHEMWGKVAKVGESQKYYFATFEGNLIEEKI